MKRPYPSNDVGCLQHIGFVVEDLALAAAHFARTFSVGSFLTIPHLEFDEAIAAATK
jgi:hypothetical protein